MSKDESTDMTPRFNETELEKIRIQLGLIIKSWSRVVRISKDSFIAFAIEKGTNTAIFAVIYDDKLLLCSNSLAVTRDLNVEYEKLSENPFASLPLVGDFFQISLHEYEFTKLIPLVEQFYRLVILS